MIAENPVQTRNDVGIRTCTGPIQDFHTVWFRFWGNTDNVNTVVEGCDDTSYVRPVAVIVLARCADGCEPLPGGRKIAMAEVNTGINNCDANAITIGCRSRHSDSPDTRRNDLCLGSICAGN